MLSPSTTLLGVIYLYLFVLVSGYEFQYSSIQLGNATDKHKRSVVVDDPVYIPLGSGQATASQLQAAYQYIAMGLSPYSSEFILYPYSFTSANQTAFDDGAIISTDANGFSGGALFEFIAGDTNITLQRAQALYDTNIAILLLTQPASSSNPSVPPLTDLTYEAYTYCSVLYNYITGKYEQCWTGSAYLADLQQNAATREATSVVYVNETDLSTGILFTSSGSLQFGVLIIPDIYQGSQQAIITLLGSKGSAQIISFVQAGGTVITSGKGALVLEALDIVTSGTFDQSNTFFSSGFSGSITGCGMTDASDTSDTAWEQRALCFAPPESGNLVTDSVTSAPLVLDAGSLSVLSYWDPSSGRLYTKSGSGVSTAVSSSASSTQFPHTLYGTVGKGQVIIQLSNSAFQSSTFGWFFNALYVAMSEPLILDTNLQSQYSVIPAGEQVFLSIDVTLINLYNEALLNPQYIVWVASGVSVTPPAGCQAVTTVTTSPPNAALDSSYYLDCTSSTTIPAFAKNTLIFPLQIIDVSITLQQVGIVLLYPVITYTQASRGSRTVILDYGPITTNAAMAAQLATDVNADPMGIWPALGSGNYVDNVHYVINKQNTEAYDVVYVSNVPLVTPFVDASNQAMVIRALEFDHLYYEQQVNGVRDYKYPFTSTDPRDFDYLDYYVLSQRSNVMAADWDTPIKQYNIPRNNTFPAAIPISINDTSVQNSQYASTITSTNTVVQQDYFIDASTYYENALPRMLSFVDPTTPAGFKTFNDSSRFWGGMTSLPSWMMNSRGDALRVNFLFGRNDLYFYNVTQVYAGAAGVNNLASVFSVDNYTSPDPITCTPGVTGASATKVVPGYYGDTYTQATGVENPPGWKNSEYNNGLLQNCAHLDNLITPENIESVTDGNVKLIHYIVRLTSNPEVQSGDDVMYFIKDTSVGDWYYAPGTTEGVSRYGDYPYVRINYLHGADFTINPNLTLAGGRITVYLPSGVAFSADPIANGLITFSADKVAIVNTTYNSGANTIVFEFKRGQTSDDISGANSSMQINLEKLISSSGANFSAEYTLEQMTYDISAYNAPEPYQIYTPAPAGDGVMYFNTMLALILPAVQLNHQLQRGVGKNESYVEPLEALQPFARQGTYMQDLKAHRTIYATAECHPVTDPGVVPNTGGYSYITSIGVSSIPDREYLTTGQAQMIPAIPSTSRVEWTDIWGRRWVEPIRSLFVDVVPLPGPLRNFMMSTTYELLDPDTNQRVLQWQSDENLIVHVQLKLKNNYEKWWDITTCSQNGYLLNNGGSLAVDESNTMSQLLSWVHDTSYGQCLQGDTILEAETLSSQQQADIIAVHLCAENQTFIEGCSGIPSGLPVLEARVAGNNATWWNYASYVADHWPENYIAGDMWDLTHVDYYDSPFLKSFPFHFDNNLPSIDNGLLKPQNIITFPVFKGIGYAMTYNTSLSHPNFPGKTGWWSDNLQNRDETIVAGQATSNTVSVGAADLTTSVGWIPITNLTGIDVASRLSNIYVCEFNRQRIITSPANDLIYYSANVVPNNIIPVDPTLQPDDERYTNYQCGANFAGYDANSISAYDNYLSTSTASDYLYFGANLRGEALETINILYTLEPLEGIYNEGETIVQDGGTFVYWNPSLGPNAFEIVDDVTSVVNAQRTDLTMTVEVFPTAVPTFNAIVIEWLHLEDAAEIGRQWNTESYFNCYGFGDAAISVYVGGANGTSVIVSPGGSTIATVEFTNNAGFDWNLYGDAIESVQTGSMPLSGNDLLNHIVHAIQVPTKYNFMTVNIPTELQPYITIVPSNYFSETAPMVFDFSNINVATIEDGFKADYYYDISVSANLPEQYWGQILEFNVTLNTQYFQALPGVDDATGVHDYTLSIPPLVLAIPNAAGVVYYTSGHAHNLVWAHTMNPAFTPTAVQFVDANATIASLALIAANQVNRVANLSAFWQNLTTTHNDSCNFWYKDVGSQRIVYLDLSKKGTQFPFPNPNPTQGEIAVADLLIYSEVPQLPYGWNTVFYSSIATFNDDVGKQKDAEVLVPQQVRATGAWLELQLSSSLYNPTLGLPYAPNSLHFSDSGVADILVMATNIGDDIAYDVNFTLYLGQGITVGSVPVPYSLSGINLTLYTGFYLPPGTPLALNISLNFTGLSQSNASSLSERLFISQTYSLMDLTAIPGEDEITQELDQQVEYPLVTSIANLTGNPDSYTVYLNLTTTALDFGPLRYVWWRRNLNFEIDQVPAGQWYVIANDTSLILTDTISNHDSPQVDYMTTVVELDGAAILAQSNIYAYSNKTNNRWWLLLAIILPIGVAALALLIGAVVYARRRKPTSSKKYKEETQTNKSTMKLKAISKEKLTVAASESAPKYTPDSPPTPNGPKKYTVDIDYLFTGARRVQVKEGNPSSIKPPEDYVDPDADTNNDDSESSSNNNNKHGKTKRSFVRRLFPCFG
jgi:hypothetical protein